MRTTFDLDHPHQRYCTPKKPIGWECTDRELFQIEVENAWEVLDTKNIGTFVSTVVDVAADYERSKYPKISAETRQLEQLRRDAGNADERKRISKLLFQSRRRDLRRYRNRRIDAIVSNPNSGPWTIDAPQLLEAGRSGIKLISIPLQIGSRLNSMED